jgi:anti-sigma regulatory factor (Ser/Thr protein kinase)
LGDAPPGRESNLRSPTEDAVTANRNFKRHVDALAGVFDFASDFADEHALGESVVYAMNLSLEELFTNIVKYGRRDGGEIGIDLAVRDGYLVIEVVEGNAEPFDITSATEPDVHRGLEQREEGGLGIHLIRSIMDYIKYEYENRNARITLKKRLEESSV